MFNLVSMGDKEAENIWSPDSSLSETDLSGLLPTLSFMEILDVWKSLYKKHNWNAEDAKQSNLKNLLKTSRNYVYGHFSQA